MEASVDFRMSARVWRWMELIPMGVPQATMPSGAWVIWRSAAIAAALDLWWENALHFWRLGRRPSGSHAARRARKVSATCSWLPTT